MVSAGRNDEPRDSEFGKRLKEARLARGWSQVQLASAVGVSDGYLSLLENGRRGTQRRRPLGRGLVINLARELHQDPELFLKLAGLINEDNQVVAEAPDVRRAIASDPLLTTEEKDELLALYDKFVKRSTRRRKT